MGKASRYGFFSPGSKDSDKEFVRHMGVRLVRELRMVVFHLLPSSLSFIKNYGKGLEIWVFFAG